jgi:hypothetical protein
VSNEPVNQPAPAAASQPSGAGHPSADQLAAEIEAAREDLVTTLAQLKEQSTPAALARRGKGVVLGFFVDEYGGVRPERIAIAVGAVATLVVLRRWRRSRRVRRIQRMYR